jgi:hypothetical protein
VDLLLLMGILKQFVCFADIHLKLHFLDHSPNSPTGEWEVEDYGYLPTGSASSLPILFLLDLNKFD